MLKRIMMQFLALLSLVFLTGAASVSLPQLASAKKSELIHQLPTAIYQTGHESSKSDGQFSDSFELEFINTLKGPMLVLAVKVLFNAPTISNPALVNYTSSGPSPPAMS